MVFAEHHMREWSSSHVAAFYSSLGLASSTAALVQAACTKLGAQFDGAVLYEATVDDLTSEGVDAGTATVMVQLAQANKEEYPKEDEDDDAEFHLYVSSGSKAAPKKMRNKVRASFTVLQLKQLLVDEEPLYDGVASKVVLTATGRTMNDGRKLSYYKLRADKPSHSYRVKAVFPSTGGSSELEECKMKPEGAAVAEFFRQWTSADVSEWLETLSGPLKGLTDELAVKRKMDGRALLAADDATWRQLIPRSLRRKMFLRAWAKKRESVADNWLFEQRRQLDLKNPLVRVTMEPDCIPFTYDSEQVMRAEMGCGHCIGPNNMFRYVHSSLMRTQNTTELECPVPKCGKVWDWDVVFAVCNLSPAEVSVYMDKIDENIHKDTVRECPSCHNYCAKPTNVGHFRIRCLRCGKHDFCWICSGLWTAGGFQFCGNQQCDVTPELNEILASCADKQFEYYKEPPAVYAPSVRACPKCKQLIAHAERCKHMTCPGCKTKFCFFCLSPKPYPKECGTSSTRCTIAPRQVLRSPGS